MPLRLIRFVPRAFDLEKAVLAIPPQSAGRGARLHALVQGPFQLGKCHGSGTHGADGNGSGLGGQFHGVAIRCPGGNRQRQGGQHRVRSDLSNWESVTVAVPMVPMAMAAASAASSMASRYDAPAEIASDRVASTVSPAPVTS